MRVTGHISVTPESIANILKHTQSTKQEKHKLLEARLLIKKYTFFAIVLNQMVHLLQDKP